MNVITDKMLINIAKENIKKYDIVPLYYEMGKAGATPISYHEIYKGLIRAHEYSGIGEVSNKLTRLWAKKDCDRDVAKLLTYYNNLVIDAAKTGEINSFDNYPEIAKRVNKATGGQKAKMPYFFQFTKNGRRQTNINRSYAKPSESTMNRLCAKFDDIPRISMKFAEVDPLDYRMFLSHDNFETNEEVVRLFCDLDSSNLANKILSSNENSYIDIASKIGYDAVMELIIDELTKVCGSIENAYPSIVRYLYCEKNLEKMSHKQMFWRIFGEIAERNLIANLANSKRCSICGTITPNWAGHTCPSKLRGMVCCRDCGEWVPRTGPRQTRCKACQEKADKKTNNSWHKKKYEPKRKRVRR